MPVTSKQVTAVKRYIAQGEVYLNVGKPASAFTSITFGGTGGAIPQKGGGGDADSVGLTSGPATVEYKPEFKGIEVEQATGEVAPRMTSEMVTLKFKCAEATYARIQAALQTGTLVQVNMSAGTANPTTAPTLTPVASGGSLATGNWTVAYAWRRTAGIGAAPGGSTMISNTQVAAVTGPNGKITVTAVSPPGGYTVDWYLSEAANSTTLRFAVNNSGSGFDLTAPPSGTANLIPTANYTANPGYDMIKVGGKQFFTAQCVALVSSLGTYTYSSTDYAIWEWVALYEAISVDGVKLDFKRTETRMVEVTITGYADVTRSEGDQLCQFGQFEDPN